jgi:hypothetical protein
MFGMHLHAPEDNWHGYGKQEDVETREIYFGTGMAARLWLIIVHVIHNNFLLVNKHW